MHVRDCVPPPDFCLAERQCELKAPECLGEVFIELDTSEGLRSSLSSIASIWAKRAKLQTRVRCARLRNNQYATAPNRLASFIISSFVVQQRSAYNLDGSIESGGGDIPVKAVGHDLVLEMLFWAKQRLVSHCQCQGACRDVPSIVIACRRCYNRTLRIIYIVE